MFFFAYSTSSPTRFLANLLSTSGVLSSMAAPYPVERPLPADFARIKAKEVDDKGNPSYTLTACNFNRLMAMAARVAEANTILLVGMITPDDVDTPGPVVGQLVARAV